MSQAFADLLAHVKSRGFFDSLEGDGDIRINVPFCGNFFEAASIAEFILNIRAAPAQIAIDAVDISDNGLREARISIARVTDARVKFSVSKVDLTRSDQPSAALAIGLHPALLVGADKFSMWKGHSMVPDPVWDAILASVVRTAPLLLITCWFEQEAKQSVTVLEKLGCECEMFRNPKPLDVYPGDNIAKLHQYVVLAKRR
jgi:hypothetical protein